MGQNITKELAKLRAIRINWNMHEVDRARASEYNAIVNSVGAKGYEVGDSLINDSDMETHQDISSILGRGEPTWTDPAMPMALFRARTDALIDYLEKSEALSREGNRSTTLDVRKELDRLKGMQEHWVESYFYEDRVDQYNAIMTQLKEKGLETDCFRIDQSDLKPEERGGIVLPGKAPEIRYGPLQASRSTFRAKVGAAIQYVESILPREKESCAEGLSVISRIGERFSVFAHQLAKYPRDDKQPFKIEGEYDVQYLLHALLCLHFEDVRPEEGTPSNAGKHARMDFLIGDLSIAVEAKFVRNSGHAKKETSGRPCKSFLLIESLRSEALAP